MAAPEKLEEKFWSELRSDRVMMIGLDDVEDGHARPMKAQLDGAHGPIWFFTARDNAIVRMIGENDRAIATFASKRNELFATVQGRISVERDRGADPGSLVADKSAKVEIR